MPDPSTGEKTRMTMVRYKVSDTGTTSLDTSVAFSTPPT
jgi:hypothetical protein